MRESLLSILHFPHPIVERTCTSSRNSSAPVMSAARSSASAADPTLPVLPVAVAAE